MRNPYKKNLPSITARPEQPGNERSGALSTTKITEETMPDLVRDMLMLARIKDNEVNEKDLEEVVENTNVLLKQHHKDESVRKMYTRYQNLWSTFVANNNIENEYDDVMLVKFFESIQSSYVANTLWVIYSCINSGFIDRFGLNLKGLPRLKKYLKQKTSKYVAKKSATFTPEEINEVLMNLQEKKTPNAILHGVAIALLYFGLLRGCEARQVKVEDV